MNFKMPKNKKLDLIWIIPEILGSMGIGIIAIMHIGATDVDIVGFKEFVFQAVLGMMVFIFGMKGMNRVFEELKEVLKNDKTDKDIK